MGLEAEQGKYQRRLAVVAAALFTTAAGMFGTFFYLQQSRFAPTRNIMGLDPVSQEKTRRANIAQASVLRDHWRAWAEQHKSLLTEMRQAKGNPADLAVRLNEALPNFKTSGLPISDLKTNDAQFTWQPTGTKTFFAGVTDPVRLASINEERQFINKQFAEGLTKHKDVIISRSVNVGPTLIALWASGRVTVSTSRDVREGRGYISTDGEPQEIQPPYDFVR